MNTDTRPERLPLEADHRTPREQQIVDAAAHVFYEKGYEAASIQDVADAVGILKGSLYYYIDSKEDLLFQILRDAHRESMRHLSAWQEVEGDALTKLRAFVEGHVLAIIENDVKIGVFFQDFRSLGAERRAAIVADRDVYSALVRDLILQGQEESTIDGDVDPSLASMGLLGMLNWTHQWYRPEAEGGVTPPELAAFFADFALSGLAVRAQEPARLGRFPHGFVPSVERVLRPAV